MQVEENFYDPELISMPTSIALNDCDENRPQPSTSRPPTKLPIFTAVLFSPIQDVWEALSGSKHV
jgi:hypothetical protein